MSLRQAAMTTSISLASGPPAKAPAPAPAAAAAAAASLSEGEGRGPPPGRPPGAGRGRGGRAGGGWGDGWLSVCIQGQVDRGDGEGGALQEVQRLGLTEQEAAQPV